MSGKVSWMVNFEKLYNQYKDIIPYGIFGMLTTIINIAAYWIMAYPVGLSTMNSTWIAWIAAVLFAYVTNKKWVFHSEVHTGKGLVKEAGFFFLCRLGTGVVDWGFMFVFVDLLYWNDVVVKIVSNIVVIVLNYVASKIVIFKCNGLG